MVLLTTSQSWIGGLAVGTMPSLRAMPRHGPWGTTVFATALQGGETPNDGNFAWEVGGYKVQVTDKHSVDPALFLPQPLCQEQPSGESFPPAWRLVKTTFPVWIARS